jgi:electron transport complex protein RnfC
MKKLSFKLALSETRPFLPGPNPEEVCIPLSGHAPTVKKKDQVRAGTCVAVHPDPFRGDAHSSIDGVVTNISAVGISITKQDLSDPASPGLTQTNLDGLEGDALAAALKSLGLDLGELKNKGDHIIINGLNPEPGIYWAEGMYQNHLEELKAALDVIRRLTQPSQISIVLPEGSPVSLDKDLGHFYVRPFYPNSRPHLVAKTVTKSETLKQVSVLGLHALWRCSQVIKTGFPAVDTIMSVQDNNYYVATGTPVRTLLAHAGISPNPGDYVVLGGHMRGKAVANLDLGVGNDSYALCCVPRQDVTPVRGANPCVNCGSCVQYCPAHLLPNIISRHAEFENYAECRQFHVTSCMDCGLCAYYCIARRPMLQYMREANKFFAAGENAAEARSV